MSGTTPSEQASMGSSAQHAAGGCLCGAVRFSSEGPFLFCAHCHCAWCQRAHGAAFVTWLGVSETTFRLVQGEDRLTWYSSSEQSDRGFCSKCGTTLFFRSVLAPGEVHIALACVDDAARVKPPAAHVFFDAHVPWFTFADDLPKLDRTAKGLAKYNVVAKTPATGAKE